MREKMILFLATGFGLGRIPVAPGTFGTLSGIPLIFVMERLADFPGMLAFFMVALILAGVWIAHEAELILDCKDPGCIVIDEMAGYCVAMSLVPTTPLTLVAGFAAFRCFDILKPLPVRWFEKTFAGGAGVMLDDIMAGGLAALLLKLMVLAGIL
ncbi:MAG: phosphohistidine phosphatase [Desulfobacterales bacterium]|nr:MAG: phosphohistidine phosphatase [Desulfobacterales bacterium]